jgi:hypothetical protein
MSNHHPHLPHVTRVLIACSPDFHDRRALMETLGSIFLEAIDEPREYYYFASPLLAEIFDDGMFNPSYFLLLDPAVAEASRPPLLPFTHVIAAGDDAFMASVNAYVGASKAVIVRLT